MIDDNPAAKVPLLKALVSEARRRAFSVKELQALLDVTDTDWRGMILFGVFTGQRLGDIIRLRWSDVEFETDTLSLTTRKTKRRQILPLAQPLREWLKQTRRDGSATGPILPTLLKPRLRSRH